MNKTIKLALAQVNPIVGDFTYNTTKVLDFIHQAKAQQVDLVVFSELCISGYSPQDLLLDPEFVRQNFLRLNEIIEKMDDGITAIIGFIDRKDDKIFNSAAVISKGKLLGKYTKTLLPNYDVFDEKRYFQANTNPEPIDVTINGNNLRLGVQICEDLWDTKDTVNPSMILADKGAEILINLSASPYDWRKRDTRTGLVVDKAKSHKLPMLLVNQVGGQDELVFDGNSVACDCNGKLLAHTKGFQEDLVVFDLNLETMSGEIIDYVPICKEESIRQALTLGVKDYFVKSGFRQAVIGLSGGIDSALVACIGAEALGAENLTCISLPSRYTAGMSNDDAKLLSENLGCHYEVIAIEPLMKEFGNALQPFFKGTESGLAEENIQSRIRGNILMSVANKHNWLTLTTGNKTEMALGYCTMYGDMAGALAVIADLGKSDVYALSRYINEKAGKEIIPERIITRPPSAELKDGQVDPFDYELVSPMVHLIVNRMKSKAELVEMGYDEDLVNDIYNKVRLNEYKRKQAAPGIKISEKAFGIGRRFPIINHFRG